MVEEVGDRWDETRLVALRLARSAADRAMNAVFESGLGKARDKAGQSQVGEFTEQLGMIRSWSSETGDPTALIGNLQAVTARVSTLLESQLKSMSAEAAEVFAATMMEVMLDFHEAKEALRTGKAPVATESKWGMHLEKPGEIAADDVLDMAGGRAVELGALLAAKRGRSAALSDSLRSWLSWSGALARDRKVMCRRIDDQHEVYAVTPKLVLQTMLSGWTAIGLRSDRGSEREAPSDTLDALEALRENGLPKDGALYTAAAEGRVTLGHTGLGVKKTRFEMPQLGSPPVFVIPQVMAILEEANRIRAATIKRQTRIDARHFAAACLIAQEAREAFTALGGTDAEWALLFDCIERPTIENVWGRESKAAWRLEFERARTLGAPRKSRSAGALLPRFQPDKPWIGTDGALLKDPLGVVADARAMADLIVLEEPGPPLAIGLFGDWGSGKSTFMEILEKAIGENTAKAKLAREQMEAGRIDDRLPFVENIAHIRFNAWHYAEADLWASLAANIFRSLYDLSRHPDKPAWLTPEAFASLLRELELAGAETSTGEAALKTAEDRVAQRRVALDDANHKRELWARAKRGDMRAAFGLLDHIEDVEALDGKLESLGLQPALGDAAALVESVRKARTLAARLASAFRKAISWRGLVLLSIGAILAALATYGASWIGLNFGSSLGLVAPLLAGALPLLDGARRAHNILSGLSQSADELESAAKTKVREASDELLEAERERADAETALRLAERRRSSLEALGDAENPQAALEAFIEARIGETGYHQNLGLISRLHDDFRSLSELLAASGRSGNDSAEPKHLQRIVLYIDDLDRCDDRTVLRVLEAVHLLLALPLFVVVVGVDARWLEGALERQYKKQLQAGDVRPEDYLEKIFQFPYWLRRMDPAEGGTFRQFLNSLLTPTEAGQADQDRRARGSEAPGGASQRDDRRPREDQEDGDAQAASASGTDVYAEVEPLEKDQVEALREAVEITPAEVTAIEALGPLITKSPRSAKRFMNLYRFEKARRMRENAEAFMGTDEMAAEYPAVMLALAMDIGLPVRVAGAVRVVIDRMILPTLGYSEEEAAARLTNFFLALEESDDDQPFDEDAFESIGSYLPAGYWSASGLTTPVEDRPWFGVLASVVTDLGARGEGGSSPIIELLERLRARGDLPRASFRRPGN